MDDSTTPEKEKALAFLTELVLDHLGIPRPGTGKHIQNLQDNYLPFLMETARFAWLTSNPYQPTNSNMVNPILHPLRNNLGRSSSDIKSVNDILENLGVHALLEDVAASSYFSGLSELKLNPYETRLLRAIGHPKPEETLQEHLRHAAIEPQLLATSNKKIEEAAAITLKVYGDINIYLRPQEAQASLPPDAQQAKSPESSSKETPESKKSRRSKDVTDKQSPAVTQSSPSTQDTQSVSQTPKKTERRTLISLGKLLSGLVLLTGNTIIVPMVLTGDNALAILGSLAGGIVTLTEGLEQLREKQS